MSNKNKFLVFLKKSILIFLGIQVVLSGLGFLGCLIGMHRIMRIILHACGVNVEKYLTTALSVMVYLLTWCVVSCLLFIGIEKQKPVSIKGCNVNRIFISILYIALLLSLEYILLVYIPNDYVAKGLAIGACVGMMYIQYNTFKEEDDPKTNADAPIEHSPVEVAQLESRDYSCEPEQEKHIKPQKTDRSYVQSDNKTATTVKL